MSDDRPINIDNPNAELHRRIMLRAEDDPGYAIAYALLVLADAVRPPA
jgi:hypothetical protein